MSGEFWRLGAADAARRIAAGILTSEALVRSCLERIAARERDVRAWAYLDASRAIREARRLDRARQPLGPLHGIPVGIKDIIDTADLPTEYNSRIYRGHRPRRDAECVARLRAAGAIILGKTETSEFAYLSPARTRNPHELRHTPGGSSSGSAAAVADCMVPLALGTQTGGSTIRPAAYCGAFALKPTYDCVPLRGVKALAPSFDTLGCIARSVTDLALLYTALTGERATHTASRRKLRIGYCETPFWNKAQSETRVVLARTARALSRSGVDIERVALPDEAVALNDGFYIVVAAEAVYALGAEYRAHKRLLSKEARRLVEMGFAVEAADIQDVHRAQMHCALALERAFDKFDALLTPSAPGEPERGRALGNNEFNRIWTALHLPCVSIPAGSGPAGLPVGVQLIGRRNGDGALLAVAERVAAVIT